MRPRLAAALLSGLQLSPDLQIFKAMTCRVRSAQSPGTWQASSMQINRTRCLWPGAPAPHPLEAQQVLHWAGVCLTICSGEHRVSARIFQLLTR